MKKFRLTKQRRPEREARKVQRTKKAFEQSPRKKRQAQTRSKQSEPINAKIAEPDQVRKSISKNRDLKKEDLLTTNLAVPQARFQRRRNPKSTQRRPERQVSSKETQSTVMQKAQIRQRKQAAQKEMPDIGSGRKAQKEPRGSPAPPNLQETTGAKKTQVSTNATDLKAWTKQRAETRRAPERCWYQERTCPKVTGRTLSPRTLLCLTSVPEPGQSRTSERNTCQTGRAKATRPNSMPWHWTQCCAQEAIASPEGAPTKAQTKVAHGPDQGPDQGPEQDHSRYRPKRSTKVSGTLVHTPTPLTD